MEKVQLGDLKTFAERVVQRIENSPHHNAAYVVALEGDLGAGKTTFTQILAKEFGVGDTVQSPTYVLMKSYPIQKQSFTKLIHIDAYRLEKPEEFTALKPERFLNDTGALVIVEWPERVVGMLPKPNLTIRFFASNPVDAVSVASPGERYIEMV